MFEDDLARTLRAVAETSTPSELLPGVNRLRRRRTQRRAQATLAALTVAAVIAALSFLVRPASPAPRPAETPKPTGTVSAERVWADAMYEIPGATFYIPMASIDAQRLVLVKHENLYVYDHSTGAITPLATATDEEVTEVQANERWVMWLQGDVEKEAWSVPVSGGAPVRILGSDEWVPDDGTAEVFLRYSPSDSAELVGDQLIWTSSDGIRRAPLAGGPKETVSGSEGMHLVQWPWAGTTSNLPKIRDFTLKNLETGETRSGPWCVKDSTCWITECSVDWCIGADLTSPDSTPTPEESSTETPFPVPSDCIIMFPGQPLILPNASGRIYAVRHDGFGRVELPAAMPSLVMNRFVLVDQGRLIFDLAGGNTVAFRPPGGEPVQRRQWESGPVTTPAMRVGDTLWVLNLKAIM
ncbi:hypothetical protein ACIHFD_10965 [Nonomuraea sp. NPDC051941]|uniref:hypothetical protein n=1 Tax=Nonomuraea sp. NPDC051941 TaxID=3364373 RepID=UPI0037C5894E